MGRVLKQDLGSTGKMFLFPGKGLCGGAGGESGEELSLRRPWRRPMWASQGARLYGHMAGTSAWGRWRTGTGDERVGSTCCCL